jgi:predicted transcriptional regulator of viral defense system
MALDIQVLHDLSSEFDYIKLMGVLKKYTRPRDQVTKLIRAGKVIRVKKGVYVLGPEFRKPYSTEVLANMIYGPSYVSGLSALSFYNLIPERLETVSSRTPNRNKIFDTPIGRFTYQAIPLEQYCISVDLVELSAQKSFLIATKEKALVELTTEIKEIQSCGDLMEWLESMRIDSSTLSKLRQSELKSLRSVFKKPQVDFLIELVRKAKHA